MERAQVVVFHFVQYDNEATHTKQTNIMHALMHSKAVSAYYQCRTGEEEESEGPSHAIVLANKCKRMSLLNRFQQRVPTYENLFDVSFFCNYGQLTAHYPTRVVHSLDTFINRCEREYAKLRRTISNKCMQRKRVNDADEDDDEARPKRPKYDDAIQQLRSEQESIREDVTSMKDDMKDIKQALNSLLSREPAPHIVNNTKSVTHNMTNNGQVVNVQMIIRDDVAAMLQHPGEIQEYIKLALGENRQVATFVTGEPIQSPELALKTKSLRKDLQKKRYRAIDAEVHRGVEGHQDILAVSAFHDGKKHLAKEAGVVVKTFPKSYPTADVVLEGEEEET